MIILLAVNIAYDRYLRHSHPILYSTAVENLAYEYNLDKFLVYAVIVTESGFDPEAVSEVGASGLMQIMPDTFDWISGRLDDDLVYKDMFNPEDNIRYGVYLLSYHMNHYNDIDCTMAAYHAGDGRVDEWLADRKYSADGKTLQDIPISDTAHYVYKINKAYQTYLKLYGG